MGYPENESINPEAVPKSAPTRFHGDQKFDFRDPREVAPEAIRAMGVPPDVRFFIERQLSEVGGSEYVTYVYRLEEAGNKLKRVNVDKLHNQIPDEEYLALEFGPYMKPGYLWLCKWKDKATGEERGLCSEVIPIGEEWRERFNAHKNKRQIAPALPSLGAPAISAAPPPSGMTQLMETIATMDALASVMQKLRGPEQATPSQVMEGAYAAAGRIMEKAVESNLKMANRVNERLESEVDGPEDEEDEHPEPVMDGPRLPEWVSQWLPFVKPYLDRILGGGPLGAATALVVKSDERFKAIANDPEKWPEAVAAITQLVGESKTQKVLQILTGEKPEPAKQKSEKAPKKK